MTAQEWQPGQRAYVEVEVGIVRPDVSLVDAAGSVIGVPTADLLPVPVPDADVIERAIALVADELLDYIRPPAANAPRAEFEHQAEYIIGALAAANLLAVPVREPGRSEAEWTRRIEGEWLISTTDRCTCSPHYGAHERHCGVEPELDLSTLPGWRSEVEIKAEALREAAAVAGLDCDGGGWNWFAQTWAEQVAGWLEDRAAQASDTEGSGT